ncbi:unnamed protein product [[Candida] boidinii]|nr:unnamed protein product [[Candida] boidinii]
MTRFNTFNDQTPLTGLPSKYMGDMFPSPSFFHSNDWFSTGQTPIVSSNPYQLPLPNTNMQAGMQLPQPQGSSLNTDTTTNTGINGIGAMNTSFGSNNSITLPKNNTNTNTNTNTNNSNNLQINQIRQLSNTDLASPLQLLGNTIFNANNTPTSATNGLGLTNLSSISNNNTGGNSSGYGGSNPSDYANNDKKQ